MVAPIALRQPAPATTPDRGSSAPAAVAPASPGSTPSDAPTVSFGVGAVDRAIRAFSPEELLGSIDGGDACRTEGLDGGGGQAQLPGGEVIAWHASQEWIVSCPHEPGDMTVAFRFVDAIRADLVARGADIRGSSNYTGEATSDASSSTSWRFLGDRTIGFARATMLDATRPTLRILVSLDLTTASAAP